MCKACEAMEENKKLPVPRTQEYPFALKLLKVYLAYLVGQVHERRVQQGKAGQTSLF
jgi:hypothetical protein